MFNHMSMVWRGRALATLEITDSLMGKRSQKAG